MKSVAVCSLLCLIVVPSSLAYPGTRAREQASVAQHATPVSGDPANVAVHDALPLVFEPNVGQTHASTRFVARGRGYVAHVSNGQIDLKLSSGGGSGSASKRPGADIERSEGITERLTMSFAGARSSRLEAGELLESKSHYLMGRPDEWRTNVANYGSVRMKGVYEGIDVRLHGSANQLEYDFEVAPGADVSKIRVRFDGQTGIDSTAEGGLKLRMRGGDVVQQRAIAFQEQAGSRRSVDARCKRQADGSLAFEVGEYDPSRPLVIDPVIIFVTEIGGSEIEDTANHVALDASGAAYVAGETFADDFPTTAGSYAPGRSTLGRLSFVAKLSPAGNALVYSTYFPGADLIASIDVDGAGSVYLTGQAGLSFPTTSGAYDTSVQLNDIFVAKLTPSGNALAYSTVIGAGAYSYPSSVDVDAAGQAHLAGEVLASTGRWPTTPGAFDAAVDDGFKPYLTKLSADGSALVFSTFLGGTQSGASAPGTFVRVVSNGDCVVAGTTNSPAFPTTLGAYDVSLDGGSDAFVMRVNSGGTGLVYGSYLGGSSSEENIGLGLDPNGNPAIVVRTGSTDYPTTPGAIDPTGVFNGQQIAVSRISNDGSALLASTYFGELVDHAAIAVGPGGDCYVAGRTTSVAFPTTPGSFQPLSSTEIQEPEGFVAKISSDATTLMYSSYLGSPGGYGIGGTNNEGCNGIAVDSTGAAYVVGMTRSALFPRVNPIGSPLDRPNAFVTKLSADGAALGYSTTLGGGRGLPYPNAGDTGESANAVAIAPDGSPVIGGTTRSLNFPVTAGVFDTTFAGDGANAFVSKLNATGSTLAFSAFLGGSGDTSVLGIVLDGSAAIYVCGSTNSTNFPVTVGAPDTNLTGTETDGFVVKISPTGSAILYSTYLGGATGDSCTRIAVDTAGQATVTGTTTSADFPTTIGAFDTSLSGASDAFVSRLNASGTLLQFSTLLGGPGNEGGADVVVDALGRPTAVGFTNSASYPTTIGAFDRTFSGDLEVTDSFVTKLASDGASLVFSTFLGHASKATAVALDASGAPCVTGITGSPAFPSTSGAFDETYNLSTGDSGGGPDGFVLKLNATGSALQFSTFIGAGAFTPNPIGNYGYDFPSAIVIDDAGQIAITGYTSSAAYPLTIDAADSSYNFVDGFLTRFDSTGSSLIYSTFLGGSAGDAGNDLAVDSSGAFYVVGVTSSGDFSTRAIGPVGLVQERGSAFVAKIGAPAGNADISVANTESADPILTGTSLSYNLSVHNAGPDPALGTSVSLPIGSGMTFASCTVSQGTFNVPPVGQTGTVLASLGTVAVGQTATVAVVVNVVAQSGATLVTTATASTLSADSAPANNIATETTGVIATPFAGSDTIGVIVGSTGAFFLKNTNAPGSADTVFTYGAGNPAWAALRGDWDGDGDDSVGLYDPATGAFFLRNTNAPGGADIVFTYGAGGLGLVPIIGDWDGNGTDSIGLYAPSTGAFFLRNSNTPGGADIVLTFGAGGAGIVPLAGDWDGDGDDTIGLYLSGSATFFLKNANAPGPADSAFSYGPAGLVPLAGDWDNNGFDTIGVFHPSSTAWFLRNSNTPGPADLVFTYGPAGAGALVGDWDGQ